MKNILLITPNLNTRSGVANHIINYYNKLKNDFNFDFVVYENEKSPYADQIINDGNKIYYFEKKINRNNLKKIESFFQKNSKKYDIMHCHTFNYGCIYLYFAKKYNIKNRILHVHSVRYSDNIIKHWVNKIFIKHAIKLSNILFTCSNEAGKKAYKNKDFYLINNCIDLNNYRNPNETEGEIIKKQLNIKDEIIFGNVGRLVKQKNHTFLIKVFNELKKIEKFKDSKLLIIGDGPEYKKIQKQIKKYKLEKDIIFKSNITNMADYYNIMNCFIFPSKKEGLGQVLIEAQASRLPCFCTNTLPKEVFLSSLIHGLDLNKGCKYWASIINNKDLLKKVDVSNDIIKNGFDISNESLKLKKLYLSFCS